MEKFLVASIGIMFVLYIAAVPFVNYYNGIEDLGEAQAEKKLVAEVQMTTSVGLGIILFMLLVIHRFGERFGKLL
jgi:hypothetical protein